MNIHRSLCKEEAPVLDDVIDNDDFQYLLKDFTEDNKGNEMNYYLPIILEREKKSFTCSVKLDYKQISEKLENLDIPHIVVEYPNKERDWFFVSTKSEHLRNLTFREFDENGLTSDYGEFLGVPEEDFEWWSDYPHPNFVEHLDITEDDLEDNIEYARLLPWSCRPTKERVNESIRTGKKWYRILEHVYHKTNIITPLDIAEDKMKKPTAWYKLE